MVMITVYFKENVMFVFMVPKGVVIRLCTFDVIQLSRC